MERVPVMIKLKGQVAIVGIGEVPTGRFPDRPAIYSALESARLAIRDAGIDKNEIDTVLPTAALYSSQFNTELVCSRIVEELGLAGRVKNNIQVFAGGASSSSILKIAASLIITGVSNCVLAVHADKVGTGVTSQGGIDLFSTAGVSAQWEAPFGTMMPAYYALYAQAYMAKNGLTHDDLMKVRIKSGTYGQTNERAVYRKGVKESDFDPKNPDARMAGAVAWPLRVGDACANADGSSCIILANAEKAKAFSKKPVWIMGIGAASEAVNMAARPDFAKGLSVGYGAAEQAYKMAGVTAKDIKVAEVHDCFTIAEIMAYEGLGFAPMGEGKQLIREKATYKEGRIPVNVDGGLLSKGHPIGATGGSQMRTIVLQLRGEAGPMQVPGDPDIGLVHNVGGVGLYGNVTIFGR